jgi:predicted transcriptional regulator
MGSVLGGAQIAVNAMPQPEMLPPSPMARKEGGAQVYRGRRDIPLEHPLRRMALEMVADSPGIAFREILRRSGRGNGTMQYHLQRLRAEDLVCRKRDSAGAKYFLAPAGEIAVAQLAVLESGAARIALEIIGGSANGLTVRQLVRASGSGLLAMRVCIYRLIRMGLVRIEPGRRVAYVRCTIDGRRALSWAI